LAIAFNCSNADDGEIGSHLKHSTFNIQPSNAADRACHKAAAAVLILAFDGNCAVGLVLGKPPFDIVRENERHLELSKIRDASFL
jgi:hypothetical protein